MAAVIGWTDSFQSLASLEPPLNSDSSPSSHHSYSINMLIPLPSTLVEYLNPFQLTHMTVGPVIELAIDDMEKRGITRDIHINRQSIDTNCSDVLGPYLVSKKICEEEINVIIGFACVYVLAPMARLSWQWDPPIPLG